MHIDENTKLIGRFHTKASPRGLNIYNPFFDEAKINALYFLFYNQDPNKLIEGMKSLNLSGAITAGFESDTRLPELIDDFDETSEYVGKIGFVTNKNGKLIGYSQGGQGMLKTINKATSVLNKKLVIVGAGNVVKGLLFNISKQQNKPSEIEIYNRTVEKAEKIAKDFNLNIKVLPLGNLYKARGDILANISKIGGSEPDNIFTEKIVSNFEAVVDVTFERENTNLINLAKKLNKKYSTGWDMFTFQGEICLSTILDQKINSKLLRKYVVKGLSEVVK